jgi:hypothetical protein
VQRIGKYEVIREIGRGSMGRVFLARHPIMDKTVAIKVVHAPDLSGVADIEHLRRRLFDEARRAGALSHPNIISIYDVDVIGELAFIVMEYIEGQTLEDGLVPGAPMKLADTVSIVGQIADALDVAHARGIIHRDIKPANIMLGAGNSVKVADFGIAKNLAETGLTKTGLVLGTPYYMAPEQILGRGVDGRTDQFALAVMAYRMFTGVRPFDGDTVTAIMYQIVNGEPKPMLACNSALTPAIADVVAKALSKDPAARYISCAEFARSLASAAAPPRPVVVSTGAAAAAPALAPVPVAAPVPIARARHSGMQAVFYIGLSVAVIAIVTAVYVMKLRVRPQAQPAPIVQTEPAAPARRTETRRSPRRRAAVKKEEPAAEPVAQEAPPKDEKAVADPGPTAQP